MRARWHKLTVQCLEIDDLKSAADWKEHPASLSYPQNTITRPLILDQVQKRLGVKMGAGFRFLDLEEVHATVSPPFRSGGTHSGSGHDWGKSPEINRKAVDVRLYLVTCF